MHLQNTRRKLLESIECPTFVIEKYNEQDRQPFHPELDWGSGKYTTRVLYTWGPLTDPPKYSHLELLAEVHHPISAAMILEHFGEGTYTLIIRGPSQMVYPDTIDLYKLNYTIWHDTDKKHDEMPKNKNDAAVTFSDKFKPPYTKGSGVYGDVVSLKDVVFHNTHQPVKGECVNIFELDQDEIEQHINWSSLKYHSFVLRKSPIQWEGTTVAGHLGCFAHIVTNEFLKKNFGGGCYIVRIRGPMRLSDGVIAISLILQKCFMIPGRPLITSIIETPPSFLHDINEGGEESENKKVFSRLYEQSSHDTDTPVASYNFLIDKKFVMSNFPPGSYKIDVFSDGPGVQAGWLLHEESFVIANDDIGKHLNAKNPRAAITDENIENRLNRKKQTTTTTIDRFTLVKALTSSGCLDGIEEE